MDQADIAAAAALLDREEDVVKAGEQEQEAEEARNAEFEPKPVAEAPAEPGIEENAEEA